MPCSVCFNSKTSKLDGHLSTLAIITENTDNCSRAKKSAHLCGCINYANSTPHS